jgi:rhodanese-related sulfurtransferase
MKIIFKYAILVLLVPTLVLVSCKKDPTESKAFEDLKNYMVDNNLDLPDLLDGWIVAPTLVADGGIVADDFTIPNYHVFDIRGTDDFNAGHIKGAINLVLADVVTTAANYADKPILVVCYSGQTAGRAVMALRLSGYSDAKVMKFGFSYWSSDTYTVGDEARSFDKWTGKIGDPAVGHQNWVTNASAQLPVYGYPTWESDNTDKAAVLAERVEAMLGMDWTTSSTAVLADPDAYNIYNFWTPEDYTTFGHYKGSYQIKPISIADDIIKAFNPDAENQVYCFTGQTSSFTIAWLQVLGYPAKSITYGVNSLSYTALDEAGKPAWHHAFEYEYETTVK